MSKKTPLCAICLLAVIAIASFVFVYLILHHHKPCKNGECLVKIDLGHLKGVESETALNKKTYYSFQGIPYAKPPVGDLRFRDPEPIEHWHSVLDATTEKNICLQRGATRKYGDVQGSEDCLYLNIYTTQFPDHDITRHPVLVYFHSGGFNYGSTSKSHLGPDYIIERDVILVTVNYRLGALGFLNLNNEDVPGNAGLKDQQLALRWVKEHIGHFGGDPNNVMIFGTSAGSASVQYHMLSPSSAGLFQKAIMESGSVLNPWAFDEDPLKRAHMFANILNINSTDTKEIADILRKKLPLDIIHFQEKVRTPEELKRCISFAFVPSVETHVYENSFLVEHPKLLLEEKRINIVPTIIGANTNEGLITLTRSDFKDNFSTDFEKFIPVDLHLNQNNPYFPKVIESVKEFYFHNKLPSLDDLDNYFKTCGDIEFNLGIQKTIDYLLRQSDIPVYVYKFSFDGKFQTLKSIVKEKYPTLKLPPGPNHADQASYLFYAKQTNNLTEYGTELEVVERITTLWTRFATFQDPNIEGSEVHWIPTKADNQTHLDIGTSLTVVNDSLLPQDRLEFWNKIYSEVLAK